MTNPMATGGAGPAEPTPARSPRSIIYRAWTGVLPALVCDAVVDELSQHPLSPSSIQRSGSGESAVDVHTRKADHVFVDPAHWAGSFVSHFATEANEAWGFDLTGLGTLSFIRYTETGHFRKHVDTLDYDQSAYRYPGVLERKLSVTVNLSDPTDYDGGELLFFNAMAQPVSTGDLRPRGTIIVFPSTVAHQVTPITGGVRDVLVGWMVGPPLR